ncbi:hypothetical protein ES702_02967 [subsurface metagenome]
MSDLIDDFKIVKNSGGDVEKSLANALDTLMTYFGGVTEFKARELFAISLFQSEDKYIAQMLKFFILNKKHIKRKFAKEINENVECMSKAIAGEYKQKLLTRIFGRFRRGGDTF